MASTKGGIIAAKKNEVQQTGSKKGLQSLVMSMGPQIGKALPTVLTPERFTRIVLTALSSNRQLQECTPPSFLGAMMQAAQLGLEPNTPLGQAYLIPYRNHGVLECQFQIGYKGLLALFYRSGGKDLQAHEVHENDTFEYELGLEPKLRHVPALTDRGPVILYYAVYHTKDGGSGFAVMSMDDIKAHMHQFSKAAGKGFSPWSTNFDEMAKKTVIKKVLKYAPMATDFVRAVAADESIKHYTEKTADILDTPNETEYETIDADYDKEQPDAEPKHVDPETDEILNEEGNLNL